jgi:AcrR family transcriptional regulator
MFEGGVAGTTMEMVRAAARASRWQIYHYFVDNESLVRAVSTELLEVAQDTVIDYPSSLTVPEAS